MRKEKLDLISLAKEFSVKRVVKKGEMEEDGYEVTFVDEGGNLAAFIPDDGDIQYYVTGCYNSGCDWLEIQPNEFDRLREFCELMAR